MTDEIELLHFDDLTKINVPFGMLDTNTRARLGSLRGVEFYDGTRWVDKKISHFSGSNTYRQKPSPRTKPSVDWSHLHDDFNYIATDMSGASFGYEHKPLLSEAIFSYEMGGKVFPLEGLASFKAGTCDWRESLVMRPSTDDS